MQRDGIYVPKIAIIARNSGIDWQVLGILKSFVNWVIIWCCEVFWVFNAERCDFFLGCFHNCHIERRFLIEFEVFFFANWGKIWWWEFCIWGLFPAWVLGLQVLKNGLRKISMVGRTIGIDWVVLEESQVILWIEEVFGAVRKELVHLMQKRGLCPAWVFGVCTIDTATRKNWHCLASTGRV